MWTKEDDRNYRIANKEKLKERKRLYDIKRKEETRLYNKKYYNEHKKELLIQQHQYYVENKEEVRKRNTKWNNNNKDKVRILKLKWFKDKMVSDIEFKLKFHLRKQMLRVLKKVKNASKSASAITLIGCSISQLKEHIEKQFKTGMTWENHGQYGWHIDHIRPCASFDLTDPIQQQQCFHYTNLQPLWWKDNLSKNAKW